MNNTNYKTLKERILDLNIKLHNSGKSAEAFDLVCLLLADKCKDSPRWLETLVEELESKFS